MEPQVTSTPRLGRNTPNMLETFYQISPIPHQPKKRAQSLIPKRPGLDVCRRAKSLNPPLPTADPNSLRLNEERRPVAVVTNTTSGETAPSKQPSGGHIFKKDPRSAISNTAQWKVPPKPTKSVLCLKKITSSTLINKKAGSVSTSKPVSNLIDVNCDDKSSGVSAEELSPLDVSFSMENRKTFLIKDKNKVSLMQNETALSSSSHRLKSVEKSSDTTNNQDTKRINKICTKSSLNSLSCDLVKKDKNMAIPDPLVENSSSLSRINRNSNASHLDGMKSSNKSKLSLKGKKIDNIAVDMAVPENTRNNNKNKQSLETSSRKRDFERMSDENDAKTPKNKSLVSSKKKVKSGHIDEDSNSKNNINVNSGGGSMTQSLESLKMDEETKITQRKRRKIDKPPLEVDSVPDILLPVSGTPPEFEECHVKSKEVNNLNTTETLEKLKNPVNVSNNKTEVNVYAALERIYDEQYSDSDILEEEEEEEKKEKEVITETKPFKSKGSKTSIKESAAHKVKEIINDNIDEENSLNRKVEKSINNLTKRTHKATESLLFDSSKITKMTKRGSFEETNENTLKPPKTAKKSGAKGTRVSKKDFVAPITIPEEESIQKVANSQHEILENHEGIADKNNKPVAKKSRRTSKAIKPASPENNEVNQEGIVRENVKTSLNTFKKSVRLANRRLQEVKESKENKEEPNNVQNTVLPNTTKKRGRPKKTVTKNGVESSNTGLFDSVGKENSVDKVTVVGKGQQTKNKVTKSKTTMNVNKKLDTIDATENPKNTVVVISEEQKPVKPKTKRKAASKVNGNEDVPNVESNDPSSDPLLPKYPKVGRNKKLSVIQEKNTVTPSSQKDNQIVEKNIQQELETKPIFKSTQNSLAEVQNSLKQKQEEQRTNLHHCKGSVYEASAKKLDTRQCFPIPQESVSYPTPGVALDKWLHVDKRFMSGKWIIQPGASIVRSSSNTSCFVIDGVATVRIAGTTQTISSKAEKCAFFIPKFGDFSITNNESSPLVIAFSKFACFCD